MEPISKHISWSEAIVSAKAAELHIANIPSPAVLANMKATAENVFEPLRSHFFVPILVDSFFRCPALNKAVGGASNSQHTTGEAIDIRGTFDVTNADLFAYIIQNLPFDQIIWEFGDNMNPAWVHVSYSRRCRHEALKAEMHNGKKVYLKNKFFNLQKHQYEI